MSPTLTLRRDPSMPGPATLRATIGEGGLTSLVPGVLGVNLIAGLAGPWARTRQGYDFEPLWHRDPEPAGENAWAWTVQSGAIQGTWTMTFTPGAVSLTFDLRVEESMPLVSPLAVPLTSHAGMLLLPGRAVPFDLGDRREATQWHTGAAGWALGSQGGLVIEAGAVNRPFAGTQITRLGETLWSVALCHRDVTAGTRLEGRVVVHVVPFNGAVDFDTALAATREPSTRPGTAEPAVEPHPAEVSAGEIEEDGSLALGLGGQTLRVAAVSDGRPLPRKHVEEASLTARRAVLGDREVWAVTLRLKPVRTLAALRLEATLSTDCGNPAWEGDATVFIPGNFARCNYHPDHMHGGGPKWGPSPVPVEEPNVHNAEAPGCCHGWTFAGSRLPQVWAAAADRRRRQLVWLGTTPRSELGENCAGFVSPEGRTTALKVATPTTYEPWVPLGYSRMRRMARRDAAPLAESETLTWTLWVGVEETGDLNAWGAYDRGLYLRLRPAEPMPVRFTLDDAAKICAAALHERFLRENPARIVYSTGPDGQSALVAFTGMAHSALVLLWAGQVFEREAWRAAGTQVLDTCARMFNEGPGFPFTSLSAGGSAGQVDPFGAGSGEPGYVVMVAFDNLAEALRRERGWGRDHAAWAQALRRCADAWVKNQSDEGLYPHWGPDFGGAFRENEYRVTNVEAGVIANMADAHDLFGEAKYLDSAKRAAQVYGRHLDDGRLWGGPGDIRALVNSEVPMFFLRGFRRLFETTQDPEHRRWMLASAAWRHAFQFAHSWPVDAGSPLWRQGWAGLGMEGASASNLHAVAFGNISVPDEWALWRLTGDEYHRQRCEDLVQYSRQQYARFAGDLGFPFAGAGTESWWTSDSVWGKGHPWIFTDPGFDLGYMSWVTGWSGYGALWGRELGIEV